MDSSEIIVTFMTNGIYIHITEVILSKKIYFKSGDLNDEKEIVHRDSLNADQKSNSSMLDENADIKFSELLNRCIYRELKDRINNLDVEALSIMIAAKQRVKQELEYYEDTIKYVALALKPFYIVCLVSISIQSSELV
jgi:hypothetical protein